MTREEHLLTILAEECMEVAQRCSKALRFGLSDVEPGQNLTNSERITQEFSDLLGVMDMLNSELGVQYPSGLFIEKKKEKVERFLSYSRECGRLAEGKEQG